MGIFDALFGNSPNPADAAMPYLNQIPDMEKKYYDPYIQQGQNAYGILNDQYGKMATDPSGFLDKLLASYKPSESYKLARDEALRAAGNSAAAGGMRGSMQDIEKESRLADVLLGEDMQRWLQNVFGIQGRGLQGQQSFYNTGFNATSNLAGDLSNVLGTQAGLAFQGQNEQNKRDNDLLGALMQAGGAAWGSGKFF